MARKWIRLIVEKSWMRMALAIVLVAVGFAPVVTAAFVDSTSLPEASNNESPQGSPATHAYRWYVTSAGTTQVQRSDDGGSTWQRVSPIREIVLQMEPADHASDLVAARGQQAVWVSRDNGTTWDQVQGLPSRPMSVAVARTRPGLLFVGTESMGLYRSTDGGDTWQAIQGLPQEGSSGPLGISAVALNPEDETIVYVAAGYWLGTADASFRPYGTYLSVDSGRHWFEMQSAPVTATTVQQLLPAAGRPLSLTQMSLSGTDRVEMPLTSAIVDGLQDADPSVRGATARLLGLSGNPAFLASLLDRLADPDHAAGQEIARAIGQLAGPEVIPTLLASLDSEDERVRARSVQALGLLRAEEAVPHLAGLLHDDASSARRNAAEALAKIGTPRAIAALMQPLGEAELTPARQAAMQAIESLSSTADTQLVAALDSPDPVMRRHAAEMLGWRNSTEAVSALSLALSDADPQVRTTAAWALGEIATAPAQAALRQAANDLRSDAATAHAVQTALSHAEATGEVPEGTSQPALARLLGNLAAIPAIRWSFLLFSLALAGAALWGIPRRVHLQVE